MPHKFEPLEGWITDMADANKNGLVTIYGEDILNKLKGCEFHFQQRVNEKARKFGDLANEFKRLAMNLMEKTNVTGYSAAYQEFSAFLEATGETGVKTEWLDWWHDRRHTIFRAFTRRNLPLMNQAEVIHAGMANKDEVGVDLYTSTEIDVKDSIFLAADVEHLSKGGGASGTGPLLKDLLLRREAQEINTAKQVGKDLLEHGVDDPLDEQDRVNESESGSTSTQSTTQGRVGKFIYIVYNKDSSIYCLTRV